jgi:TolB-like protein
MERKLATILAADVAGYSRMVANDEEGTLRTLALYRKTISGLIAEHAGRIFGTAGDSVIAEFASPVQSVRAAVAIQRALHRHNVDLPQAQRMEFRLGINLGDVVSEDDDLLGDGVNVAARLQQIAEPTAICISSAIYEQIRGKLNFPMVDLGEVPLKNIPRPVRVYSVDWTLDIPIAKSVLDGEYSLPDRASIAVLPFNNMSGDPEQEYFADGITEDIITALSQYRWFFVIARNSTFTYKGRAVDIKRVARELGVRYVLEGSVRKAGARVRVTSQLIDAEIGTHLWAERYDRDYADVFSIQDEITESVVGAIEPEILVGEGKRAARKPIENLDAFDCCMRGVWHYNHFTAEETAKAVEWLRRSTSLDPKLARAHMYAGRVLGGRCWYGFSQDLETDLAANGVEAELAVSLDDRDPYSHYALAFYCMMTRQHQRALTAAQQAIDLSPNFALGFFALGFSRIYMGRFEEALEPLLRCIRLSPHDPMGFLFLSMLALAYYHLGRYEESIQTAERALRGRRIYVSLRTFAAALGQLGQLEKGKEILEEMKRIEPADFQRYENISNPYADRAHFEHLRAGLLKAGTV